MFTQTLSFEMSQRPTLTLVVLIIFFATACDPVATDALNQRPPSSQATDGGASDGREDHLIEPKPNVTTLQVYEGLSSVCASCHGVGSTAPYFASLTHFTDMIATQAEWLNPDGPTQSPFYLLLAGDGDGRFSQMPPAGSAYGSLAANEPTLLSLEQIADWIGSQNIETDVPIENDGCLEIAPSRAPMRRLTHMEYKYSIQDIFALSIDPTENFPAETEAYGFNNNADFSHVTRLLAEQYESAAKSVARVVIDEHRHVSAHLGISCNIQTLQCAQSFFETVTPLLYRRALWPQELERIMALWQTVKDTTNDRRLAAITVLEVLLQSPYFLYRPEIDTPDITVDAIPVTGYEMASRLAYFLWTSAPDRDLLNKAASGQLSERTQILAVAESMLDDPRSHRLISQFYLQWLGLNDTHHVDKNRGIYPQWSSHLADSMNHDIVELIRHLTFNTDGSMADLFTTTEAFVDDSLAPIYGLEAAAREDFEITDISHEPRAGILTRAAFLAVHAKSDQSSPVLRGVEVREKILCQPLAPPPQDVDDAPPALDPSATTRERFAAHTQDPACAGCHTLIDPVGFGFENFDGLGRYRTQENGLPIDSEINLFGTHNLDGDYDNINDLSLSMATDEQVERCFIETWHRYSLGRSPEPQDQCRSALIADRDGQSPQPTLKGLILRLVASDDFLYRRSNP